VIPDAKTGENRHQEDSGEWFPKTNEKISQNDKNNEFGDKIIFKKTRTRG